MTQVCQTIDLDSEPSCTLHIEARLSWAPPLRCSRTRTAPCGHWSGGSIKEAIVEAYATTPAKERQRRVEAFQAGRARVLVNVGLFTEGTDLPGVDSLFLARPTRSKILFQQMVGRGMRGPRVAGRGAFAVVAFHESIVGFRPADSDILPTPSGNQCQRWSRRAAAG